MSSAAVPRDQDLAHQRRLAVAGRAAASATTSSPTPREAFTSTVSPGAHEARHAALAAAAASRDARATRRRTARRIARRAAARP